MASGPGPRCSRTQSGVDGRIPAPEFRLGGYTRKWITDRLNWGQIWLSLGGAFEYQSRLRFVASPDAQILWQPVLFDPGLQFPWLIDAPDMQVGFSAAPTSVMAFTTLMLREPEPVPFQDHTVSLRLGFQVAL